MRHITFLSAGLTLLALLSQAACANIIVTGTRVIVPAGDGETTVNLHSRNTTPVVAQAWVDGGNESATPETANAPFLITPPMLRMEPDAEQALRVLFTGNPASLPADRESLFYFNVLEIPPKPAGTVATGNYFQMALRTRLKLFYRPEKLAGNPEKAIKDLTFKAVAGGHPAIVVHNASAYYVTVSELSVQGGGKLRDAGGGMVAPFSDLSLTLTGSQAPATGSVVSYSGINDYGGTTLNKKPLTQ